jgi:hypothetical protein
VKYHDEFPLVVVLLSECPWEAAAVVEETRLEVTAVAAAKAINSDGLSIPFT